MDDSYRRNKIIEMSLLFVNQLENNKLLQQKISTNNIQPLKYYLLPKEWIEEYKNKNDYSSITESINPYMSNSFKGFKALLNDKKTFDSIFNGFNKQLNNNEIISTPKIQGICPPNNFIPVKEEIINEYTSLRFDFYNKNSFLFDIIIGENKIFVLDKNNSSNIYLCLYNNDQEFFYIKSERKFKQGTDINEMIKNILQNDDEDNITTIYKENKINTNNTNNNISLNLFNTQIGKNESFKSNNINSIVKTNSPFNQKDTTEISVCVSQNYDDTYLAKDYIDDDELNNYKNKNKNESNASINRNDNENKEKGNSICKERKSFYKTKFKKMDEEKNPLDLIQEDISEYKSSSIGDPLPQSNYISQNSFINNNSIKLELNSECDYKEKKDKFYIFYSVLLYLKMK